MAVAPDPFLHLPRAKRVKAKKQTVHLRRTYIRETFSGKTRTNLLREFRRSDLLRDDLVLRSVNRYDLSFFREAVIGCISSLPGCACEKHHREPLAVEIVSDKVTSIVRWSAGSCPCLEVQGIVDYLEYHAVRFVSRGIPAVTRLDITLDTVSAIEKAIAIGKYAKVQKRMSFVRDQAALLRRKLSDK